MNAKTLKRGFTIVELVIVIAVIAILAAVIIPTAVNLISNSQVSADTQLVKNLNTVLSSAAAIDGEKNATAHDAFLDAEEAGYNVEKLTPTSTKHDILWDSSIDRFVLVDAEGKEVFPKDNKTSKNKVDLFKVYTGDVKSGNYDYSIYLAETATPDANLVINVGFDAGYNTAVNTVNYTTDAEQSVIIRTTGGTLVVSALNSDIAHHEFANIVDIKAVKDASFHEFGLVNLVKIEVGHFVAEAKSQIKVVAVLDTSKATLDTDAAANVINTHKNVSESEIEKLAAEAGIFTQGIGTKDNPYIVYTAGQMQQISELYDSGYNYFKIADGISTIDCNGWKPVYLNGSFDGNGVAFINVANRLFQTVGYKNQKSDVVLANFTATLAGPALVGNVFTSGTLTFENINVHGKIEGEYNLGSFYQYGTCNYDGKGASYSVYFVNAKSDATIINTTGNTSGGMIGHAYEGEGNTFKMYVDENSGYTGTIFGNHGHKYIAMNSNYETHYVNDVKYSWADTSLDYTNVKALNITNPTKGENGYTVDKVAGATSIKVSINGQLSIPNQPNQSGMTWVIKSWDVNIEEIDSANLLALVDEAVIINDSNYELNAVVENGVLKVYTGRSSNYATGNFTLSVVQYDANGNVLAIGNTLVASVK